MLSQKSASNVFFPEWDNTRPTHNIVFWDSKHKCDRDQSCRNIEELHPLKLDLMLAPAPCIRELIVIVTAAADDFTLLDIFMTLARRRTLD